VEGAEQAQSAISRLDIRVDAEADGRIGAELDNQEHTEITARATSAAIARPGARLGGR